MPALSPVRLVWRGAVPAVELHLGVPKHEPGVGRSAKTSTHPHQTATNLDAYAPDLSANRGAFFGLILLVRAVYPLLGTLPADAHTTQRFTDGIRMHHALR